MAYVEVKAKTIEMAIEAAMRELGVTDRERLEIEVLQEPERGFLGIGARDAIVKVTEKPAGRKRARKKGGSRQAEPAKAAKSSSRPSRQAEGKAKNMRSDAATRHLERGAQSRLQQHRPRKELAGRAGAAGQGIPEGLLEAIGLKVGSRPMDDDVVANVIGEQTEALAAPWAR